MELILENIGKDYGNDPVLFFEKLQLNAGIYWIKGSNGTGKTTLFRIIAGQTPFHGQVSFQDVNLKRQPVKYRSLISYAEAEPQYPGYITGKDLIQYFLSVRQAAKNSVADLIELFGMTRFLDQKIGGYSSGMLKKLSLICAFIGDIKLFLLDEPLITIDTASANVLYQLINFYRAKGCTFLISSHQDLDYSKVKPDQTFMISNAALELC
ncbi:MAG: ABC transporter ATP-binding protein [Pedobacter sp.]|nr:MAG: ABC transporter ATP-binding protein [Pedobacter sp.]